MKTLNSTIQNLRVQRGLYTLLGAFLHTFVCFLLWVNGLFHVSAIEFIGLFSVIWAGYLFYFILLKTGVNQRFQDPDLIMSIVFWAVSSIMYTVALTTELRALLLMFNLLALVFSAFYLSKKQYVIIIAYSIFLYVCVIVYLANTYPKFIDLKEESAVFVSYVFLSSALAFICYKMNDLRKRLNRKNKKLAIAIKHSANLSVTDDLTKIKNRRYIFDILRHQVLMAKRGQYFFAVCMLDVDHFKKINDIYGHLAGDEVLKAFCNNISLVLREIDYFARIGGEEFLFVLPLVDETQAKQMAERIRMQVEKSNFDKIAIGLKITASLGVVAYQSPEKIETTLARVDEALYSAKRSGRNQVATN
jgi:diguanylate cyclase (GGDEF)-like protein